MIQTTAESHNETGGNGQFGSLLRKKRKGSDFYGDFDDFTYLDKADKRMRFNNSQDPIHYVFDVIDNRPMKVIAKEFVKDSIYEICNFVSKVVG